MIARSVVLALMLGLTLCVTGCAGSTGTSKPSVATSTAAQVSLTTTRVLEPGVTVRAPSAWQETQYHGELATVVFPLVYLSTKAYSGPCVSGPPKGMCNSRGWFPKTWSAPTHGVLVLWIATQFPISKTPLSQMPGKLTRIDGHPAKVWSGQATQYCASGADTELDAYVPVVTTNAATVRYDMTACFGPHASAKDHAAVEVMLESLRVAG